MTLDLNREDHLNKFLETKKELEDAISFTIKLDYAQVTKIVVTDLINSRNCLRNKVKQSFDDVLRHYLTEDEFQKHVINNEPLK